MSSTIFPTADAFSFDRTIAGVKGSMESATGAQADLASKATQAGKDMMVFSQDNVQAIAQATQVFAAGSQDLLRQMAEAGQAAMSEMMSNIRAAATATSPKAMIELQANLVRTATIQAITDTSRLAHAGVDLAERVSAPLMARTVAAAAMATTPRA